MIKYVRGLPFVFIPLFRPSFCGLVKFAISHLLWLKNKINCHKINFLILHLLLSAPIFSFNIIWYFISHFTSIDRDISEHRYRIHSKYIVVHKTDFFKIMKWSIFDIGLALHHSVNWIWPTTGSRDGQRCSRPNPGRKLFSIKIISRIRWETRHVVVSEFMTELSLGSNSLFSRFYLLCAWLL